MGRMARGVSQPLNQYRDFGCGELVGLASRPGNPRGLTGFVDRRNAVATSLEGCGHHRFLGHGSVRILYLPRHGIAARRPPFHGFSATVFAAYGIGATVGSLSGGRLADQIGAQRMSTIGLFGLGGFLVLIGFLFRSTILLYPMMLFLRGRRMPSFRRSSPSWLSAIPDAGHGHGVEQCGPLQRHCAGSMARRMGDEPMAVSCIAHPVWNDCSPDRADKPGAEERLVWCGPQPIPTCVQRRRDV